MSTTEHTATGPRHCFDFDLEQLGTYVASMHEDPDAGKLTIRSRHRWDGGFATDGATAQVSYGKAAIDRRHAVRTDWPREFGGSDSAPMAGQLGLAAVGACVATTFAAAAVERGVTIDGLEVAVAGHVDLRGAFALGEDVPVAYSSVDVSIDVTADADDEVLRELAEEARQLSPMYRSFANPVPMELHLHSDGATT